MEIRIVPVIAVTVSLAIVVLAIRASKAKGATNYLDDPNTTNQSNFDAKEVSEILYEAMNQWGTDNDVIMQTLGEVSENQFKSVVLAFGSRNYNTWTGDEYGLLKYTLKEWLKSELALSEYLTLKSKFRKYL